MTLAWGNAQGPSHSGARKTLISYAKKTYVFRARGKKYMDTKMRTHRNSVLVILVTVGVTNLRHGDY